MPRYSRSEDISPETSHTQHSLPSIRVGVCKSPKGSTKKGVFFYRGLMASREGDEMQGDLWHGLASHNCIVSQCVDIILVSLRMIQRVCFGGKKTESFHSSLFSFLSNLFFVYVRYKQNGLNKDFYYYCVKCHDLEWRYVILRKVYGVAYSCL
jgi:hypothetical protein